MHVGGQRCLVLAIETRQKPVISIWDISREEQTRIQCVTGHEARNGRWAGAAVADFAAYQAVVTTRDRCVQLWDLRHLSYAVAKSDPNVVCAANPTLHVHGLGTTRARAACSSQGGNIHLLDVTGEGGEIPKVQTLYGHLDDVRWINLVWPTEEEQAVEEYVHGATLSVDGELLLWDFPWPVPDDKDVETGKEPNLSEFKMRRNVQSDAEEQIQRENEEIGSPLDTPTKGSTRSPTRGSSEPEDDSSPEVRRKSIKKSKSRHKMRMPDSDTKITPRMLPSAGGLRCRAVAWQRRAEKDEICALTGAPDGHLHGWLEGDSTRGLQILKEAEVGAVPGHTDQVTAICADFQREVAVTTSLDKTLRIWQFKADFFNCVEVLEGHNATVRALVCDFEIGRAISAGADQTLRIWDLGMFAGGNSAGELGELSVVGSGVRELLASFSAGHAAAVTRDGSLSMWDLERMHEVAVIDTHPGAVFAVQIGTELGTFSPASGNTGKQETQTPESFTRAALLARMTPKVVQPAVTCGNGYAKSLW